MQGSYNVIYRIYLSLTEEAEVDKNVVFRVPCLGHRQASRQEDVGGGGDKRDISARI